MLDLLHSSLLNIWYIALVVFFFGGCIFVHELGHFLAARWRGLKIDRFSIGFGPKIVSWVRGGVEYRLSWIPLGGYVALPQLSDMRGIEGEPSSEVEQLPILSYTDKMIVSVAGAVFNVLFAFLIACLLWVVKEPVSESSLSTTVGYVVPVIEARQPDGTTKRVPSPASLAGLQIGDRIVAIDGNPIHDWNDISASIVRGRGWAEDGRRQATFTIERDQQTMTVVLHPRQIGDEQLRHVGIAPAAATKVDQVPAGSLAEAVGLKAGDYLHSLGGVPIRSAQTYADLLGERGEESLELVVKRGAELVTLTVPPRPHPKIVGIARDSHAHRLGLRHGDLLVAVNDEPIRTAPQFAQLDTERTGEPLKLTVQRGADVLTVTIPERLYEEPIGIIATQRLGESLAGDMFDVRINPFVKCANVVRDSYRTLVSLIDRRTDVGLKLISGPIEIVRVYHMVAKAGLIYVLSLTIAVNISLAVFNVLPIPVLDGGHMLFATITKLRRRPISPEFLMRTQATFMLLLLSMVIYVSFFNVNRWHRDATRERAERQIIWEGQDLPPPSVQ